MIIRYADISASFSLSSALNISELENFMVATLELKPLEEFFEKHFYNVAQHSITKEAYVYWETVKKLRLSIIFLKN